ncbi:MAG: DJ-1 family glyoxalase III [Eubacteriales bacterium]
MVVILLGTGFEEVEALAPCDVLRRGGVDTKLVGLDSITVAGGRGISVQCDMVLADLDCAQVELLVIPGGLGGVASISGCPKALEAIQMIHDQGGYVAAICAGPTILAKLGLLAGKEVTGYPTTEDQLTGATYHGDFHVVVHGNIITAKAAGSSLTFGKVLTRIMADRQTAIHVMDGMYGTTEAVLWVADTKE